MDAKAVLEEFIDRYQASVAADARRALAALHQRLPSATRLVYDNYNALVVGFATTDRAGDAIFSIALYPRYVRLFFLRGTIVPDPHGLLEGTGSRVRSLKLDPVSKLESQEIGAMIDAAIANAAPRVEAGEGRLIIKSVSAKQRPRRPKS
jgi:hypothetical protein